MILQNKLPLKRRCELLEIPRSTAYYESTAQPAPDAELMLAMDKIHLDLPFYGSRRIRDELVEMGFRLNRKKVQRLMLNMGLMTLYPKANLSKANHAHKVYPYLLHGLAIERPNQVWCADITYIPMRKGFL